jgi:hypothetical protein
MIFDKPKVDGAAPEHERVQVEILATLYEARLRYGDDYVKNTLAHIYKELYGAMNNKDLQQYL